MWVLQAGSFAEGFAMQSGNRHFGPADEGIAENVADAAPADSYIGGMAVPPQSGPPPEVQRKGVLSRVLDDISGAVRSAAACLSRQFAGRVPPAAAPADKMRYISGNLPTCDLNT